MFVLSNPRYRSQSYTISAQDLTRQVRKFFWIVPQDFWSQIFLLSSFCLGWSLPLHFGTESRTCWSELKSSRLPHPKTDPETIWQTSTFEMSLYESTTCHRSSVWTWWHAMTLHRDILCLLCRYVEDSPCVDGTSWGNSSWRHGPKILAVPTLSMGNHMSKTFECWRCVGGTTHGCSWFSTHRRRSSFGDLLQLRKMFWISFLSEDQVEIPWFLGSTITKGSLGI